MLISFSTLLTLIVGEYITRVALKDITTTSDFSSYFTQRWKSDNPLKINAVGFRERDYSLPPKDGVTRIAVIGDSIAFGQGIKEEDRFSNIIEKKLNLDSVKKYEVLNFGKPGAETIDHIKFLEEHVLESKPDYILLQWFVNDVEGTDYTGRPSSLRLIPSTAISNYLHVHSALYYLINIQWQSIQKAIGLVPNYSYIDYLYNRFENQTSKDWLEAQTQFKQFIAICRNNKIPVGVVMFPLRKTHIDKESGAGFILDRLIKVCDEEAVHCLDLRPAFDNIDPNLLIVNKFDNHPNERANKIVADLLINKFLQTWNHL